MCARRWVLFFVLVLWTTLYAGVNKLAESKQMKPDVASASEMRTIRAELVRII